MNNPKVTPQELINEYKGYTNYYADSVEATRVKELSDMIIDIQAYQIESDQKLLGEAMEQLMKHACEQTENGIGHCDWCDFIQKLKTRNEEPADE